MKSIFRETEEGGLLYRAARYIQKQTYKIAAQDEDGRSFSKKFPRSPQHHRVSDDIAGRQIACACFLSTALLNVFSTSS